MSLRLLVFRTRVLRDVQALQRRTATAMRYKPRGGKPPMLPPAKTKRYQVVTEPWMNPDDVRELLWRRQAYNTALASIRDLFKAELEQSGGRLGIDEDIQVLLEEDQAQFARILEENGAENARLAEMRGKRMKADAVKMEEKIDKAVNDHFDEIAERQKLQSAELQSAREEAASSVTPRNLEERILEALENPTFNAHNVALDVDGVEYVPAVPVAKYIESSLPPDTRQLYHDIPVPLKPKDEDQMREKQRLAGRAPTPVRKKTDILSIIDGSNDTFDSPTAK